jgi:copper chaperone
MDTVTYSVPGMHCGHCKDAVERELAAVEGVAAVEADLESKLVRVSGSGLSDEALRGAIEEAGYEPE